MSADRRAAVQVTGLVLDSRASDVALTVTRTYGILRGDLPPRVSDLPPDYADALLLWLLDHPNLAALKGRLGGLLP